GARDIEDFIVKVIMYANTEKQDIEKHSIAVGIDASELGESILGDVKNKELDCVKKNIIEKVRLAGFLHEVGKADPSFQKFIINTAANNKDLELESSEEILLDDNKKNKYRLFHNQISYEVFRRINPQLFSNSYLAAYSIYHHHTHVRNKVDGKEL